MPWLLLILIVPYLYLLLKIWSGLAIIQPYRTGSPGELFVAVVVASRNEEKDLPALLKDLSEQEYDPQLFEVIIVDDNSSDRTFNLASSDNAIKNLKVMRNNGTGKKQAIITGVDASSADVIITTDSDNRIEKRWLTAIASFFNEKKPDMVICPVSTGSKAGFFSHFAELEFLSLQGVTAGTAVNGNPVMCNGANLVFSKKSFIMNSGKLHPELVSGDDVFLLHGIKEDPESKVLWLESEDATVTTELPSSISSFLKQRARWISKAGAYRDSYTIVLGIVTFVTILLQLFCLAAGFFNPVFLAILVVAFILKSIPDYLILSNTAARYKKNHLRKWFIPSQVIYPFYILAVSVYSLLYRGRW